MKTTALIITTLLFLSFATNGQFIDTSKDRVKTPLTIDFKLLGTLKTKSTKEIQSSRITVGCETLDRGYTDFNSYKLYLPPLGVKKIRLQAGWAKIEKVKGVYDWKWLDEIIEFAVANNIEPWLEASYGNPIYEGGGGTNLLNSLMTSPEGYAAWDRWVEALVNRYKGRVKEWEIWNEPDHPMQKITPETTAELNIRTAEIIKKNQPEARIAALALATHTDTVYLDRCLKVFADQKKMDLFEWISYHSYAFRPEDSYKGVASFQRTLSKYSSTLKLRQGENGAPSNYIPNFALSKYYWTEYSQAKYDLRRLLGDLGRNIETSVFTIIDIYYYYGKDANNTLNTKGLIQTDTSKNAIRPKVAYYAVQNLASIFQNDMEVMKDFKYKVESKETLSIFGHKNRKTGDEVIALWADKGVPANSFLTKPITLTIENGNFANPVWIDLLTGNVHELPNSQWSKVNSTFTFKNIPVYDSPILIADRSVIKIL